MIFSSFLISFLFVVIVDLLVSCEGAPLQNDQMLLIVSYDGFRPEYLNRNVTPNLNKFHSEGTSARFMLPVFPTKTFVNHFTIATVIFVIQSWNFVFFFNELEILNEIGFVC